MKEKVVSIFWGIVLIALGGYALITGITSFSVRDPRVGIAVFAVLSALFFTSYFLSGPQKWGWLFPAFICLGLAVMTALAFAFPGREGGWVATPLMISIAAPFLAIYLLDRKNWWALIPGYVMTMLGVLLAFVDSIKGEVFSALFLFAIGLPFLVVYLMNRTRRWALIPFAALTLTGLIPLLATQLKDEALGAVINFVIGAPFLVVYLWSRRNWWALIPAGVMISTALGVLLAGLLRDNPELAGRLVGAVISFGIALTFGLLWLRRHDTPTAWAIYPAAGLAILGAAALLGGEKAMSYAWPLALIIGGGLLFYNNWHKKNV